MPGLTSWMQVNALMVAGGKWEGNEANSTKTRKN